MDELFPVASGIALGLLIAGLIPARLRGWALGLLGVGLGVTASWISGELAASWGYALIDVAQVLTAASMTWGLAARWRRSRRAVLRGAA